MRRTSQPLNAPPRVTTAVADVDLEVRGGSTVALVGPSGSGKSTLLEALAGLVTPSAGSVELGADPPRGQLRSLSGANRTEAGLSARWERRVPPREPSRRSSPDLARAVAWVPQRAASTIVRRTVRDEVLATSLAVGADPVVAGARADLLLDRLGLAHLATADPRQLSGGEQRRLAVAAAVVHQPSLVLADEPTVGQDRLTWAAVVGILDAVRGAGSAVVVATHDDAVVARADAVMTLEPRAPVRGDSGDRRPAATVVGRAVRARSRCWSRAWSCSRCRLS